MPAQGNIILPWMSGPRQDIRFAIPHFQRTIENLVGGQAFTLRLSGVQGLITCMTVMIHDLTQSTYVVQPLRQLDLLDPAGASLLRFIPTVSGNLQVNIIYYSVGMLSIERSVLSTTQS